MGDDILRTSIHFYIEDRNRVYETWKRIERIAKEHRYKRLSLDTQPNLQRGFHNIEIGFRMPDHDGDPDQFHHCDFAVFVERLLAIMRQEYGPEDVDWYYSGGRMP